MRFISSSSWSAIVLAASTFAISLFASLFTYRYLWENADEEFLVLWLVVFETSQLLLLLDLGFSHSFIRERRDSTNVADLTHELASLRTVLAISGAVAFILSLIISYVVVWGKVDFYPFILLGLSVLITICSYAETAALRLLGRNFAIYGANIFGCLIYLIIVLYLTLDVKTAIAVACLARAVCQFTIQRLCLSDGGWYGWPKIKNYGSGVIALNASYFVLFMLDGFFLTVMGFQAAIIAMFVVNNKLYRVLQGFWNSIFQALLVSYTKKNNKEGVVVFAIIISYLMLYFISETVLKVWLGEVQFEAGLSLSLCLSIMALSLYRSVTLRSYFQGHKGIFLLSSLVFVIKVLFFFWLYFGGADVLETAYLAQAGLICSVTWIYSIFIKKRLSEGFYGRG